MAVEIKDKKVPIDDNSALRVCACKGCLDGMDIETFSKLLGRCRVVLGYHNEDGKFIEYKPNIL